MKYFSLIFSGLLVLAGSFTQKLAAQCDAGIAREAYNGGGTCDLPVLLRAHGNFGVQAVDWYENGNLLQTYEAGWQSASSRAAGSASAGSGAGDLNAPGGICIDRAGNLYIADKSNHRIQKWAPGAASGVTVAGTGTAGTGNDQLSSPADVFVDTAGNIFIADAGNNRIQKWLPGAVSGTTVAGSGTAGSGANQLNNPTGVYADGRDTVYVADANNHRIQKWAPSAATGTTVAGDGISGNTNSRLNTPADVFVGPDGSIYISDKGNHRIQKWAPNTASGTTVAGTGVSGFANDQLNNPNGIVVDGMGNLYIADVTNFRVQQWTAGATSGVKIVDRSLGGRPTPNLASVALDSAGNLYLSDIAYNCVFKYNVKITDSLLVIAPGGYKAVLNGFNGCVADDSLYVRALPPVTVTPTGTHAICRGQSLEIHTVGGTGLDYQWYRNGIAIPQAIDSFYAAADSGVYKVTVSNGTDCSVLSGDSVTLTVNPLPQPEIIWNGNSSLAVSGLFDHYQWYLDGNLLSGDTGRSVMPAADGNYTVAVTDGNGCSGTSSAYSYALGFGNMQGNAGRVRIFPNPAQSVLYIDAPFAVSVSLSGIDGRQLMHAEGMDAVDITGLPDGIYLLQVKQEDGRPVRTEKLIKSSR